MAQYVMATTLRFKLTCKCGQEGHLAMRENDAPFSRPWEEYSVSGFEGGDLEIDGHISMTEAMQRMKVQCRQCQMLLNQSNLGDMIPNL